MTFINYLGVRFGGQVQVALTFLKVSSVLAIIFLGFALAHGNAANFHPLLPCIAWMGHVQRISGGAGRGAVGL